MLKIAVVEDDPDILDSLQEYLRRYSREHSLAIEICPFHDGAEIVECYTPCYDIIFMDIEMPVLDGMNAARKIRETDQETVLVFITNMAQYAVQGYSVQALDFVLKPLTYYGFSVKMSRAMEMVGRRASRPIVLNTTDGMVRMETRQIYYIEIRRGILHYFTEKGEFTRRGTLQNVRNELERDHFVKGNYYYLVNLMHVMRVGQDYIEVNNTQLPLSRRNRSAFLEALSDYVGSGL